MAAGFKKEQPLYWVGLSGYLYFFKLPSFGHFRTKRLIVSKTFILQQNERLLQLLGDNFFSRNACSIAVAAFLQMFFATSTMLWADLVKNEVCSLMRSLLVKKNQRTRSNSCRNKLGY